MLQRDCESVKDSMKLQCLQSTNSCAFNVLLLLFFVFFVVFLNKRNVYCRFNKVILQRNGCYVLICNCEFMTS